MMHIDLVVFDMAGTTVYDGDAVNVCLRAALQAAGCAVTRDAVNEVMGLPKPEAIRRLIELRTPAAATPPSVDRTHADFVRRMIDYYRHDPAVRETDDTTATFRTLKAAGIKVAVDTGFDRQITNVILDRLGWERDGLLDTSVTSDEVPRGRPHPDMVLRAMRLTGVSDPRCVAKVGDTPSDLYEGHNAGCGLVIGVTSGSHTRAELEPHPHTHLIERLAELPALLQIHGVVITAR
jgi:phosphonatase-like hydrolase